MKKLVIFLGVLVALIFGAGVFMAFKGEALIAEGVSTQGSKMLDTPVKLGQVSLAPFSGQVQLQDFSVGQPKGFGDDKLVSMDSFTLALKPASLLTKHIQMDVIDLNGFTLNAVLKEGKTNFQALMDKLGTSEEAAEPVDIRVSAKSILLRNMKASFQYNDGKKRVVDLADVELKDLGVDQNGMPPKEMIRHALAAIEPQIMKAAVKIGLKSELKKLDAKLPDDVKAIKDKAEGLFKMLKKKKKTDK